MDRTEVVYGVSVLTVCKICYKWNGMARGSKRLRENTQCYQFAIILTPYSRNIWNHTPDIKISRIYTIQSEYSGVFLQT